MLDIYTNDHPGWIWWWWYVWALIKGSHTFKNVTKFRTFHVLSIALLHFRTDGWCHQLDEDDDEADQISVASC